MLHRFVTPLLISLLKLFIGENKGKS